MKVILALCLLFPQNYAFDIIQEEGQCQLRQRYQIDENDKFIYECQSTKNGGIQGVIIGCLSENDIFMKLGTTRDVMHNEEMGLRVKCYYNRAKEVYGYKFTVCLMGKEKTEVQIDGEGIVHGRRCFCNEKGVKCLPLNGKEEF